MPHQASRKWQWTAKSEPRSSAGLLLHRVDARKEVAAGSLGHRRHKLGGGEGHGNLHSNFLRSGSTSSSITAALGSASAHVGGDTEAYCRSLSASGGQRVVRVSDRVGGKEV
jgi:hypothetical protein